MSETRLDESGKVIAEHDMKLHGDSFHCSCGNVIHISTLYLPDLFSRNVYLTTRIKALESALVVQVLSHRNVSL